VPKCRHITARLRGKMSRRAARPVRPRTLCGRFTDPPLGLIHMPTLLTRLTMLVMTALALLRRLNRHRQPLVIPPILPLATNTLCPKSATYHTRRPHPYELDFRSKGRQSRVKDQAVLSSLRCIRYATILTGEIQLTTRRCVNFVRERHKLCGKKTSSRGIRIRLNIGLSLRVVNYCMTSSACDCNSSVMFLGSSIRIYRFCKTMHVSYIRLIVSDYTLLLALCDLSLS